MLFDYRRLHHTALVGLLRCCQCVLRQVGTENRKDHVRIMVKSCNNAGNDHSVLLIPMLV